LARIEPAVAADPDSDEPRIELPDDEAADDTPFDDEDEPLFERFKDSRSRARDAKRRAEATAEVVETAEGLEGDFVTTYQPSRHERGWLHSSLGPFYAQGLIDDVLASVKGGKEASVYRCRARPETGHTLLAAKVYRPRQFRNLRNDKAYREGRPVLGMTGRPVKESDKRAMRALSAGTEIGKQMEHTSWLMYEFTTLERLKAAGAPVPEPVAVSENAILMGYAGDGDRAAPTLHEVALEEDEAVGLFEETMRAVAVMLSLGFVHGDLSAYNILYWAGEITVIDFPQVVPVGENPHWESILARDVERVCDYFARQGVDAARHPGRELSRAQRVARTLAPAREAAAAGML
jgi:RIO kinase 1